MGSVRIYRWCKAEDGGLKSEWVHNISQVNIQTRDGKKVGHVTLGYKTEVSVSNLSGDVLIIRPDIGADADSVLTQCWGKGEVVIRSHY